MLNNTTEKLSEEEAKNFILSQIATTFSDDLEFLRKVKITFGLISKQ